MNRKRYLIAGIFLLFVSMMIHAQSVETITLPEGLQAITLANAAQVSELSVTDTQDLLLPDIVLEGDMAGNTDWFRALATIESLSTLQGADFTTDYAMGATPLIEDALLDPDMMAENANETSQWFHGKYNDLMGLTFSPDATLLAVADSNGTAALWDIKNAEELIHWQAYTDYSNGISFTPDGLQLITLGYDGDNSMIGFWDPVTGETSKKVSNPAEGYSLSLNADGTMIAIGSDITITLWDVATQEIVATLQSPGEYILKTAFSPDGSILASGSDGGTIYLWDVAKAELVATLTGELPDDEFSRTVNYLSFSPDSALLLSTNRDGLLHLWGTTATSE